MTELLRELEAVVGMAEKATPGEWVANDGELATDLYWADGSMAADALAEFADGLSDPPNAPFVAAAVNFIRAHHAKIAEAVKDARRWRHARTILPVEYIEDSQREFESYGLPVSEEESIAADEAIDAAMRDSAREGSNG